MEQFLKSDNLPIWVLSTIALIWVVGQYGLPVIKVLMNYDGKKNEKKIVDLEKRLNDLIEKHQEEINVLKEQLEVITTERDALLLEAAQMKGMLEGLNRYLKDKNIEPITWIH